MVLGELVVVDAVDDGEVGAVGRGRDDHALGAGGQVGRGLLLRGEDAGALERDVDAELLVRQLRWVLDGGDLERALPTSIVSPETVTSCREAAVHAVEAEEVGIGLDRAEIVDGHDLDVLAARLDDGAQTLRPMRPKPLIATRTAIFFLRYCARRRAACAIASAVMPKCL
jgi:hypothetical protein